MFVDELLINSTKYSMTFKEFLLTEEGGGGHGSDFFYGLQLYPSDAGDYAWANDEPSELYFLQRRWQNEKKQGRKFHNINEPEFQKVGFISVQDENGTPKVVKHKHLISLAIGKNSEDRRKLTTENPQLSFDLDSLFGDKGTNSVPKALESVNVIGYDTVSPNKTGVFNQGMGIRSKYVGPDDTGENPNEEKPKMADFGFDRNKKRSKSKKHMHK